MNILFDDNIDNNFREVLEERVENLDISENMIVYIKPRPISLIKNQYLHEVYVLNSINDIDNINKIPPYTILFQN